MTSFQNSLMQELTGAGWTVRTDRNSLSAERVEILSKWMLGKRSLKLKLELKFDETIRTLFFREIAVEQSSGIPPPTLNVSTTTQSGTTVSENRRDISLGGGGTMAYGKARQWVAQRCASEGWVFVLKV